MLLLLLLRLLLTISEFSLVLKEEESTLDESELEFDTESELELGKDIKFGFDTISRLESGNLSELALESKLEVRSRLVREFWRLGGERKVCTAGKAEFLPRDMRPSDD